MRLASRAHARVRLAASRPPDPIVQRPALDGEPSTGAATDGDAAAAPGVGMDAEAPLVAAAAAPSVTKDARFALVAADEGHDDAAVVVDPASASLWLKFPDGDKTVRVPVSYDEVVSTGFVWRDVTHRGSVDREFHRKKQCLGVLSCPRCAYVARPYTRTERKPHEKVVRAYKKKDYREFCRGACCDGGDEDVALQLTPCECTVAYWSKGSGVVAVSHSGTHLHSQPPSFAPRGQSVACTRLRRGTMCG